MKVSLGKVVHWILITAALVWTLFPIYWIIVTSFKHSWEVMTWPPTPIPLSPTLENYVKLITVDHFYIYIMNSFIVSVGSTIIAILLGSMAAYGLARIGVPRFVGPALLLWVLIVRMIPPIVIAIPLFVVLRSLGLLDTRLGLIIAYQVYTLPYVIWLLLDFFRSIPRDIEEAALVDGATRFRVFTSIMLPMALPALVATAILSIILTWNEFLYALIFISSPMKYTVTVIVSSYIQEFTIDWGRLAGSGILSAIPVLILSMYVQKYMLRGLAVGGLKI